jgi:acyl carrier protein
MVTNRRTSSKFAPGARVAIERGIPVKVVDTLIDLLAVEEADITFEARLAEDLGADELDVVELAMLLEDAYQVDLGDELVDAWIGDGGTIRAVLDVLVKAGATL